LATSRTKKEDKIAKLAKDQGGTAEVQTAEGKGSKQKAQEEDKSIKDKREDKVYLNNQLNKVMEKSSKMTQKEKIEALNKNLKQITRTSVKEMDKMTTLMQKVTGAKVEKSKKPIREMKLGETLDSKSLKIYNYEMIDGKVVVIWKDKNNLILKDAPVEKKEIEGWMWQRMKLARKARENKKFELLLNTVDGLMDKMVPQSP